MSDQNRVLIFDTTLRDGEQAPGASMTHQQKVEIADILDQMNVDIIEAGFPASSDVDFNAVREIAERCRNSSVAGLSRARRGDIDSVVEALRGAQRPRIHTFISTSPIHMEYKLNLSPDEVLDSVKDSVTYARRFCDDVEWSCEDGTRSDLDFLRRCFETAIKAGAKTVNIADTVGYSLPQEFYRLVKTLIDTVPGMEKVRFSVHCHDDLGLSVANSLAAVEAGARQIECTINGLGERAGNASLEELVMAMHTRSDIFPYHTGVKPAYLSQASEMVAKASGFTVQPNKAIVGANAFAHESGIHQHGVINHPQTYEIIDPAAVGADGTRLVMGRHSGRHAFRDRLKKLGIDLGDNALEQAFSDFKAMTANQKQLSDDDIEKIARRHRTTA